MTSPGSPDAETEDSIRCVDARLESLAVNVPLVSGEPDGWYRIHHLWEEAVERSSPSDERSATRLRAFELFREVFPEWVQPLVTENEKNPDQGLFTADALEKRNPNYISIYSGDYKVPGDTVRRYYGDLLTGKLPYAIVFDARTPRAPKWIYPRTIDSLRGHITILQRKS